MLGKASAAGCNTHDLWCYLQPRSPCSFPRLCFSVVDSVYEAIATVFSAAGVQPDQLQQKLVFSRIPSFFSLSSPPHCVSKWMVNISSLPRCRELVPTSCKWIPESWVLWIDKLSTSHFFFFLLVYCFCTSTLIPFFAETLGLPWTECQWFLLGSEIEPKLVPCGPFLCAVTCLTSGLSPAMHRYFSLWIFACTSSWPFNIFLQILQMFYKLVVVIVANTTTTTTQPWKTVLRAETCVLQRT